jgi:hypothetical protein
MACARLLSSCERRGVIRSWRESYNLARSNGLLRVFASVDQADGDPAAPVSAG